MNNNKMSMQQSTIIKLVTHNYNVLPVYRHYNHITLKVGL